MKTWRNYNIKLPQQRTEEQEIRKGKKPVLICKICGIVYYKKSWHHPEPEQNTVQGKPTLTPKTYNLKPILCPACQMIKNKQFEGKLTIKNIPPKFTTEIINLIQTYSERAFERDPLDRLIKIKKENSQIIATFTENQLAVKTAKKIRDIFNKVKLDIKYSSEPSDVVEVKLNFKENKESAEDLSP